MTTPHQHERRASRRCRHRRRRPGWSSSPAIDVGNLVGGRVRRRRRSRCPRSATCLATAPWRARRGRRCRPRRRDGLRRRASRRGQPRPRPARALRAAATDAAEDGVEFDVNSGWRSAGVPGAAAPRGGLEYGSEAEAARWVATPDTSPHVSGDAVDIGPADATAVAVRARRRVRAVPDLPQRALALRAAARRHRHRLPAHVCRPRARSEDAAVTSPLRRPRRATRGGVGGRFLTRVDRTTRYRRGAPSIRLRRAARDAGQAQESVLMEFLDADGRYRSEHAAPQPPAAGDETAMLLGFLERQRATFAWKSAGLDEAGLRARLGTSEMTLGGMLKHLARLEDDMSREWLLGQGQVPPWSEIDWDSDPTWDWRTGKDEPPQVLYARWQDAVDSRAGGVRGRARERRSQHRGRPRAVPEPALRPAQHDRGVRPPQRSRGSDPRVGRRARGSRSAGLTAPGPTGRRPDGAPRSAGSTERATMTSTPSVRALRAEEPSERRTAGPERSRHREPPRRGPDLPARPGVRGAGQRQAPSCTTRPSATSRRFWARLARERLTWYEPFDDDARVGPAVREVVRRRQAQRQPTTASTATSRNGLGDKVAYHWIGEPGDTRTITYADLLREVQKAANALKRARRRARATGSRSTCR